MRWKCEQVGGDKGRRPGEILGTKVEIQLRANASPKPSQGRKETQLEAVQMPWDRKGGGKKSGGLYEAHYLKSGWSKRRTPRPHYNWKECRVQ